MNELPSSSLVRLPQKFSLRSGKPNSRFRPISYNVKAYPIDVYPCRTKQAAAAIHNIMNNLDPDVAQFPHELITYGGERGSLPNWAQYRLTLYYLSQMTEDSKPFFEKLYAMGVTMYGQMTAGSYCYIGPQGIVHGTTLTLLNAARKYLKR
ncbi:unnamed protein product [Sphagnum balticum]